MAGSRNMIEVSDLGKMYRLGSINALTLRDDFSRMFDYARNRVRQRQDAEQVAMPEKRDFWALKDVNFQIREGDVVGIIGKNGAGKSTLLKVLSKVTAPTTGLVKIKGKIASLLEIGTGFHPELSGKENVYLNGAILGMKRNEIRKKFDEIVAFSGVEKIIDTPVTRYSSGMYVRLAFAVAAYLEADTLIVDEVLAVGDAEFQKKALGKMNDAAQQSGRTILLVSHNMGSISDICNNAMLFENGRLAFYGEKDSAIEKYLTHLHSEGARLDERNDHIGTGEVRVRKIHLMDENLVVKNYFHVGEKLNIYFDYISTQNEYFNLCFGILIRNASGGPVVYHHSHISGLNLKKLPPEGRIQCQIHKLMLPPGRYFLTYGVYEGDIILELLENAIEINVEIGTYNHSYQLHPISQGKAILEAEWSLL